ncbi:MAG: peptidoglycan-binding domain-containing protein [bacterium]|nr:peptidoglycan-binding domain-containing protein [bacterium]
MVKSIKNTLGFLATLSFLVSPALAIAQVVPPPTLTLSTSKVVIIASTNPVYANLPTISWSSTNATSCNASGTGWSGKTELSGSQKVNPSVTTIYIMTCVGNGGSVTNSLRITVIASQVANVIGGFNQATGNAASQAQTGFTYAWNRNLRYGLSNDADVSALQTALTLEGVYSSEVTGGFFNKTYAGVKLFQEKYGIESIGLVGPLTRAKLNELYAR